MGGCRLLGLSGGSKLYASVPRGLSGCLPASQALEDPAGAFSPLLSLPQSACQLCRVLWSQLGALPAFVHPRAQPCSDTIQR